MLVFVTGIDGFVGRWLTAELVERGHEVVGSTYRTAGEVAGAERTWSCDVRDPERVAEALAEARPEAVVHLAARSSGSEGWDDPLGTFATNGLGTLNVLEAIRDVDPRVVLVVTSSEVYGAPESRDPVGENAPLAPVSPYGASKAAQDVLAAQAWRGRGLPVVRCRSFPHTGPGQDPRFVFASVARRIALAEAEAGADTIEVGWLGAVRDLADVRDVARAYALLLDAGQPGEAYNVCTGRGRSIREALDPLLDLARRPVRLAVDDALRRPADPPWMVGDPRTIERATGWRASIPWESTLRDLLAYWRARVAAENGGPIDEIT